MLQDKDFYTNDENEMVAIVDSYARDGEYRSEYVSDYVTFMHVVTTLCIMARI